MASAAINTADPATVSLSNGQTDAGLAGGFLLLPGQFTFSVPTAQSAWPGYASGSEPYTGYVALTAAQGSQFAAAVGVWDSFIAPDFTRTDDASHPGTIRIGFNNQTGGAEAYTLVYGAPIRNLPANASDIWFNTNATPPATTTFATDSYAWEAMLHELGHALGLKHSFEGTPIPTPYENTRYTIMSYTESADHSYTSFSKSGTTLYSDTSPVVASTPMVLDIQAVQDLYGADPKTASGDTTYTFDIGHPFMKSIYDAGGTDTIDLSNLVRGSTVDLDPGSYSSIGYWSAADQAAYWQSFFPGYDSFIAKHFDAGSYTWSNNLGLAFSTTIENATGSAQADTIIGNSVANLLNGGGGDDTLSGAAGSDVINGGAGIDTISGGDDPDHLYGYGANGAGMADGGDTISGGAGSDYIQGNAGADHLAGDDGDDRIQGGADDDVIAGGAGADQINGNAGNDQIDGGDGNDVLHGGKDNDVIHGGADNDTLFGDLGNDELHGGPGIDLLIGGDGADTFSFDAGDALFSTSGPLAFFIDRIGDFAQGTDHIHLAWGLPDRIVAAGSAADVATASGIAQTALAGDAHAVATFAVAGSTVLFFNSGSGLEAVQIDGLANAGAIRMADFV